MCGTCAEHRCGKELGNVAIRGVMWCKVCPRCAVVGMPCTLIPPTTPHPLTCTVHMTHIMHNVHHKARHTYCTRSFHLLCLYFSHVSLHMLYTDPPGREKVTVTSLSPFTCIYNNLYTHEHTDSTDSAHVPLHIDNTPHTEITRYFTHR